jgi:D-aspartate ligase
MVILPRLDTRFPALIFKASTVNHGAVGIARTLGRLGVPVYAVVEDCCTPLASSRYITKSFVSKSWLTDRETFLNKLSTIAEIIGRPTILIPLDDLSAIFIAENATALSQWFLFPRLPGGLPRQLANNESLYSLCARIGVPCARSVVPRSIDDVREFGNETTFPIVLKAAQQWRLLDDRLYNPVLIWDREALLEAYELTKHEVESNFILQEYIAGENWIYHGYCNSDTQLFVGFTGKKLLDYPADAGSTAIGLSVRNDELCSQTEAFLRTVRYSGICDVDWRKDKRDGQYKILDCNPRIGMNFRMFENSGTIDVVRAQHLDLTGRTLECAPMIEGRLFTSESLYFLSYLQGGHRNRLTTDAHIYPETRELAWWSRDDPIPFFVMAARLMVRTIMRRLRPLRTIMHHLLQFIVSPVKKPV